MVDVVRKARFFPYATRLVTDEERKKVNKAGVLGGVIFTITSTPGVSLLMMFLHVSEVSPTISLWHAGLSFAILSLLLYGFGWIVGVGFVVRNLPIADPYH